MRDNKCGCNKIEDDLSSEGYSFASDSFCREWLKKKEILKNNHFDDTPGCHCPCCGRIFCDECAR